MGSICLTLLAQMHPRLLTSIVMLDAIIIHKEMPAWITMTRLPSFRKDLWPSRQAAETAFRKNALLKPFDERVVQKILEHSIRATPTLLYPGDKQGEGEQSYTLTTPKHQEALSVARPNYEDRNWSDTVASWQERPCQTYGLALLTCLHSTSLKAGPVGCSCLIYDLLSSGYMATNHIQWTPTNDAKRWKEQVQAGMALAAQRWEE
jgi:hypothetical protein